MITAERGEELQEHRGRVWST